MNTELMLAVAVYHEAMKTMRQRAQAIEIWRAQGGEWFATMMRWMNGYTEFDAFGLNPLLVFDRRLEHMPVVYRSGMHDVVAVATSEAFPNDFTPEIEDGLFIGSDGRQWKENARGIARPVQIFEEPGESLSATVRPEMYVGWV